VVVCSVVVGRDDALVADRCVLAVDCGPFPENPVTPPLLYQRVKSQDQHEIMAFDSPVSRDKSAIIIISSILMLLVPDVVDADGFRAEPTSE
jgi:hypothetical protein